MATSLTLQNDPSLPQGYLKVNGSTAATLTTSGIATPQATIGSLNGILKATDGVVSNATTSDFDNSSLSDSPMVAKAWVNFNGNFTTTPYTIANGGIRSAYNVSSITDNGSPGYGSGGDYTVNFIAGTFTSPNYVSVGSVGNSATSTSPSQWCFANADYSTLRAVSGCRVGTYVFRQEGYVTQANNLYIDVAFFGN